jgi:AcrR family transcriptional regulator
MGRKERKVHFQHEIRQEILDAARAIALVEGWRNVTMRKIAEKIEYSHAALYEYFENKDVLLLELLHEGFRLLTHELQVARGQGNDAEQGLRLMLWTYWDFAWRYPELYRVMNGLDGVSFNADEAQIEGQKVGDVYGLALKEMCIQHGKGVNDDYVDTQVHLLWSCGHGIISLAMAKRISGGQERARALYTEAVEDALRKYAREQG